MTVSAADEQLLITITLTPVSTPTPAAQAPRADGLSPSERSVLEALTGQAQAARVLARLTGYKLKTVQGALTHLRRRDLAELTPDGYRLRHG